MLENGKQALLRSCPRLLSSGLFSWKENNGVLTTFDLCLVEHALISSPDTIRRPTYGLHWSNACRFAWWSRHWHVLIVPAQTSSLLFLHLAGRNGRERLRVCASKRVDAKSLPISQSSVGRSSPQRRR